MRSSGSFSVACCLLALTGSCAPSSFSKLDDRKPQESCVALAYGSLTAPERQRAMHVLRRWLGLRIQAELLTPAELQRLGGAPVVAEAGYGEKWLVLGTTLATDRDEVRVELDDAVLSGTKTHYPSVTDHGHSELFGLARDSRGAPMDRPPVWLPWPSEILDSCQVRHRSGWETFTDIAGFFGHVFTLGIFWWGPKLVGIGSGGGASAARRPDPKVAATVAKIDEWESSPPRRAAERFKFASFSCQPDSASPCTLYTLFRPAAAGTHPVDPSYERADLLRLRLIYSFPHSCKVKDEVVVALSAGDPLAEQLRATWPTGLRPLDELVLAPPPAPVPEVRAAPSRPLPPLPPLAPVVSRTPLPLPPGELAIRVLDRATTQQVLGVPLRPDPDALLYACHVGPLPCQLRIETHEQTWRSATPNATHAKRLVYFELNHQRLLDKYVPEVMLDRLQQVTGGPDAPLSLLERVGDHHRPTQERVVVQVGEGERQAVFALPPGTTLAERVARALAAVPAGTAQPSGEARECQLGFAAACLALASRDGSAALLLRACRLGEGSACRRAAAGQSSAEGLFREGCILQDLESCGELARSLERKTYLSLESQKERASAYGQACSGGLWWACNDLAVLIGRIAEYDTKEASRPRSQEVMTELLKAACAGGDSLACANQELLAAKPKLLDGLKPERPLSASAPASPAYQ